jgi:hypothetical protein
MLELAESTPVTVKVLSRPWLAKHQLRVLIVGNLSAVYLGRRRASAEFPENLTIGNLPRPCPSVWRELTDNQTFQEVSRIHVARRCREVPRGPNVATNLARDRPYVNPQCP